MDLTIEVVITLFVAFIVGGAVILFSQRTLNTGQQNLGQVGKTADGVQIISLSSSSNTASIEKLARSCAQIGVGSVSSVDCFVVKGVIPSLAGLDGMSVGDSAIKVTAAPGASALFIAYNGGKVIISS